MAKRNSSGTSKRKSSRSSRRKSSGSSRRKSSGSSRKRQQEQYDDYAIVDPAEIPDGPDVLVDVPVV
jgi:hypothetical protein